MAYLKSLQTSSGSIPGAGGEWSLTSLAAAGTAAANVRKSEGSTSARSWYRALIGNASAWPETSKPSITEYERAALAAYAAGIDPARVSQTQNLIAQIISRYQTANPGYYGEPGLFEGTIFALLALADTRTREGAQRVPQVLLEQSIAVLRANQHNDGGWSFARVEGNEEALKAAAEPDTTGAAMAALCSAGVKSTESVIVKAKEYLQSLLIASSGAFKAEFGANTDSNSWAVQGLNACGISAQEAGFTTSAKKTPIDFLISQQLSSGAFRYLTTETSANELASADAVRALAGAGFTATPPVPAGGLPQWEYETSFSSSTAVKSPLALIINNGTSTLKACSVSVAPGSSTTTLEAVLRAAEASSSPTGCVTGFKSEGQSITQINGSPATAAPDWNVSIDGGAEAGAATTTVIHVGDTIYLRLVPVVSYAMESAFSTGPRLSDSPSGIAVNSAGDIWVSEWYRDTVEEFSPSGSLIGQLSVAAPCTGQLSGPLGLALDSKGDLWVADSRNNRVLKFSPEGRCELQAGSYGSGKGQFFYPTGVAIAPNGDIWVIDMGDDRAQELNPETGEEVGSFGSFGTAQGELWLPMGLAVDSKGDVWVSEPFAGRVQEFSEGGKYEGEVASEFPEGQAVAIGPNGDVWIADGSDTVRELTPARSLVLRFGSAGLGAGELTGPNGLTVDSEGNVWVSDQIPVRVEKWSASAASDVAATALDTVPYGDATPPGQTPPGQTPAAASTPAFTPTDDATFNPNGSQARRRHARNDRNKTHPAHRAARRGDLRARRGGGRRRSDARTRDRSRRGSNTHGL